MPQNKENGTITPDFSKHSNIAFIIGYLLLLYLVGFMAWPFISSIIFAGILAGTFYPLATYFHNRLLIRRSWAALLVCLIIIAAIFVPSIYLVIQLSKEAIGLYQNISENLTEELLEELFFGEGILPRMLQEVFHTLNMEYNIATIQNLLLDGAKNASTFLFDTINVWISNTFSFFFQLIIMLVIIFALLIDGERLKRFILDLSPLPDDEEELVIQKFNQMNFVTLIGNGIGGLIQGILAGVGFWFAGLESVVLWTTSMVIFAFIPLIGISFVYIPACIYLWIVGQWGVALILFFYCTAISLIVEQWFKPKFVGNRVKINSTLVFLAIIGGMSVYGVAGIFYGPLILSIFLTFVNLYHKRYSGIYKSSKNRSV